jgi:hypothetical protein
VTGWVFRAQFHAEKWIPIGMKAAAANYTALVGGAWIDFRSELALVAFFAFVTLGTALSS